MTHPAITVAMRDHKSALATWTDVDGNPCAAWVYGTEDGKPVMPEFYMVSSAVEHDGRRHGNPPGYFPTRHRSLAANANRKTAEALRAAILAFDMPAEREAFAEAARQKRADDARERRRCDIALAVATIRGADADEVASASLDLPPDVASAVMRLAQYRTA